MENKKVCALALVEYFNARRTSLIIEVNKVKKSVNRDLLMPLKTYDRKRLIEDLKGAIITLIGCVEQPNNGFNQLAECFQFPTRSFVLKEALEITFKGKTFPIDTIIVENGSEITLVGEHEVLVVGDDLGLKQYINVYRAIAETID